MKKVLIIGANGLTGSILAKKIKKYNSYEPVAMIRDSSQQSKFDDLGMSSVIADLEGAVDRAFEDIDKVIFVAGSGSDTGPDKTMSVDKEGAIKSIDAAIKAGVTKYVMLSAIGADDPSSGDSIHTYLKAKQEAERYLINSGLDYAIVRAGKLSNEAGTGRVQIAPRIESDASISREDVADVLIECLDSIKTENRIIEITEGDKPIQKEMLEFRPNEV